MKWQRPRLPQQARPLWSLFPVCLPGKDHVTSPEGNADIIVSLTHVRPPSFPPSLPPSSPAFRHLSPASLHHPASSPTTHACSHLFLCLPCATLSFVFFFLVDCLLDCLGQTHTHTHTHTHTLRVPFSFPFFNKPFLPFHSLTDLWLLSLRSGLKIHFLFLYRLDISSKKKKNKNQKGPEKLPDQRWGRTEQGGSIQPLNFLLQWAWRFRCREFGQTGLIYLFLLHLSSLVFRLLLQAGAPFPPRSQTTGPSSPWRREHV